MEAKCHTRVFAYHIVFATKNRQPLITPDVEPFVHSTLREISIDVGGFTFAVGGVEDHVHTISAIPPTLAVSDFIRKLKAQSTSVIKAQLPSLKEFAWQTGYGCFTLNPHEMAGAFSYVRYQRQRHGSECLWEEYKKVADCG